MQMTPRKEILNIRGITDAKYLSLIQASIQVSNRTSGTFKTAADVKSENTIKYHISTGSSELDELLGGGVESSSTTEVYGEYRSGKSQLCMTMAVIAQLGAHGGKVIYVDTEGSFRPERLQPICERFGVDYSSVLDNILVARVYTTDRQMDIPTHVEAKIDEDDCHYSLLIIDSIMALFRTDFAGRGELSERQQRLGQHLNLLKKLAERHNMAVLYTNL
mmetsp:Transcript_11777/g.21477  ORF Transcript_11777/g.21477 Transcript_11777/m.21477 type:complete len:219 (-) Transcript_11777:121-777(-)